VDKKALLDTTAPNVLSPGSLAPIESSANDATRPATEGPPAPATPQTNKLQRLYRSREAMAMLGCGHSKFYDLINSGTLDARRFGARTFITSESIEKFIASLPPVVTPTIARAGRHWWAEHSAPQSNSQKQKPGADINCAGAVSVKVAT
jgi:hypothetical protein